MTIILLGEFVAEVMRGISSQEYWSLPAASTAFGGMALVFFLRWLYFEGAGERHVHTPEQVRRFHVWSYAHLPLFLGPGVAGVGLKRLIAFQEGEHLHNAEAVIFAGSVAVTMVRLPLSAAFPDEPHQFPERH